MNLDSQFSQKSLQTGKVSVSYQNMRGIVMNKVHIQCDCISDSLLSYIASAGRPKDPEPSWLRTQLQQKKAKEEAEKAGGSSKRKRKLPPEEKTLIMRVKSAEFKNNELLLVDGELHLQGEIVIVSNGIPYFQNKSLLVQKSSKGPPLVKGSQMDKKRLKALASKKNETRNLYYSNSRLLLEGQDHRPLMQDPEIHFGRLVIPMASVAKTPPSAESISEDVLKKLLFNYKPLSDPKGAVEPVIEKKASKVGEEAAVESNKLVMTNSRCILKDNSIRTLHGLLHVGCAWHRVNNGLLIGSDPGADSVTISGTPIYKNVTDCEQLLLNNVILYSRGSTLYVSNTALLQNAVLHADGKKIRVEDLHLVGICGMEPPEGSEPARIFVQDGKFSVGESSLDILEGAVWFKDVKVKIPEDSTEEVHVQDSIVFILPNSRKDSGASGAPLFENQDIVYKDNNLLLEDLTPLLKSGFVSHGNKQKPLAWLSDDPETMQRAQFWKDLKIPSAPCNRDNVLNDGVCILDKTGLYVIEGTMIVNDKKVIVKKGVPLFSSDFSSQDTAHHLDMMPPWLTGRVLLDADRARDLGAKLIKGFAILTDVNMDIRDGQLIINQQTPVISDCKLVLNQRVYNQPYLGINRQMKSKDDSRGSKGVSNEPIDSGIAQVIDKGARTNQQQPQQSASVNGGSIKSDPSIDSLKGSYPYDSGRGTSAFDSVLSDNDQTRTNENLEMPEPSETAYKSQESEKRPQSPGNKSDSKPGARSPDVGRSDGKKLDYQGKDGRTPDDKGLTSQFRNPDGQSLDSRSPDSRGRESDGFLNPDSRMLSGPGRRPDGRSPDGRSPDGRSPDSLKSNGRVHSSDGRSPGGHDNRPVDAVQSADDPRPSGQKQSPGSGGRPLGGKASPRNRDNEFGAAPLEHQIPLPAVINEASAGMVGSIRVSSNQANQLLVSLRSRIEKSLHFLDGDN